MHRKTPVARIATLLKKRPWKHLFYTAHLDDCFWINTWADESKYEQLIKLWAEKIKLYTNRKTKTMKYKFQEGQINENGCKLKWTKLDKLRIN